MHQSAPITYKPLYRQWFVTGYEEARQILTSRDTIVGGQIDVLLSVSPYSRLSDKTRWAFRNMLLVQDPPDHTRLRKLISKAFRASSISGLEPRIRKIADNLRRQLTDTAEPELMGGFIDPLVNIVIADFIGIPEDRWTWSREKTDQIVKLMDPMVAFDPVQVSEAMEELFSYFDHLADERQRCPADDLTTQLVHVEEDGERLNRQELILLLVVLLGAGSTTTGGLLGNATLSLLKNPGERDKLRDHPEIWNNAVEELCRFDTSVKLAPRINTHALDIGGFRIPARSQILVQLDAANRDPRRFQTPNQLQLDREDPRPVSFGYGIHHCLGAAISRLEITCGLQTILDLLDDYDIREMDVEWRRSMTFRGPRRIPIAPRHAPSSGRGLTYYPQKCLRFSGQTTRRNKDMAHSR